MGNEKAGAAFCICRKIRTQYWNTTAEMNSPRSPSQIQCTPLHAAARGGHYKAVEILIAAKASVNAPSMVRDIL
jgi:hypothetical protein